jgi:stage III sporulation protein SpoIIIAA
VTLLEREITEADIKYVVDHIGTFGDDNRAGIERTLHRISAIRNRTGKIVGLTCRIGRAVYGTIEIINDFVESGKSILIMGRPGIGKTTMLREAARVLADDQGKRVVVVDTSNEIAGDGDIPHPAIGRARRMQVRTPSLQHEVMIEAVENHMPEVIVIDEIGTELEAQAARTIAERGVQLIGTAHGNNLDNLMLNPTLTDLIGGIQTVTLGDEEARRRRSQKSVLERKAPPTFDVIVEILDREKVTVHADVAETSTRCCAATRSPPSCAGATRAASTARSRGPSRRRARRSPAAIVSAATVSPAWSAPARAGGRSRAGAARARTTPRPTGATAIAAACGPATGPAPAAAGGRRPAALARSRGRPADGRHGGGSGRAAQAAGLAKAWPERGPGGAPEGLAGAGRTAIADAPRRAVRGAAARPGRDAAGEVPFKAGEIADRGPIERGAARSGAARPRAARARAAAVVGPAGDAGPQRLPRRRGGRGRGTGAGRGAG